MKRLVAFDLDGTLAPSKGAVDEEMGGLLARLMGVARVAVISGGDWPQFEKQVLDHLPKDAPLASLSILPTSGTKFYEFDGAWKARYAEDLSADERKRILDAFAKTLDQSGFKPGKTWGDTIEDRGTQITFSALGQAAPIEEKSKWDPDFAKRKAMKGILDGLLPGFSVRLGGTTSIDVTKPGIDKAYGIGKLRDVLGIPIAAMLFVGDAIFPGGNDYPAKEAGCDSICVRDPEETKRVIEAVVACGADGRPVAAP